MALRGTGISVLGILFCAHPYSFADVNDAAANNPENWQMPATDVPPADNAQAEPPTEAVQEPSPAEFREILSKSAIPSTPQSELFPEPAGIRPNVDFWVDMYTKYTGKHAVIHDAENLGIRYEVVDLSQISGRASRRYISRQLTFRKKYYASILAKLAAQNGDCLGAEECRVAALFGGTRDGSRYRDAIDNLRTQHGLSDRFRNGLITSGQYMPEMRKIFTSHKIPLDLLALPHVESSFNVAAYSRVGAAGIWQFMRSTGRHFMKINGNVDERRDPLTATDGAARFLKANYSEIGSWPLTVTSYNHGKNGMMHAKRIYGDNIEAIIRNYHGPAFGFASRNFYTEFLAARKIMQNPEKYFGVIDLKSPMRFSTVKIDGKQARGIVDNYGMKAIAELNPGLSKQILRGSKPIPNGYVLRVPAKGGAAGANIATHNGPSVAMQEVLRPAPSAVVAPTFNMREDSPTNVTATDADIPENMDVYVAKRGDTLSSIARRFNASVEEIKDINDIHSKKVRRGQKFFVPSRRAQDERIAATAPKTTPRTTEIISAAKPVADERTAAVVPMAPPKKKTEIASASKPVSPEHAEKKEPETASAAKASVQGSTGDQPAPLPAMASFKMESSDADSGVVRVKAEESLGHYANWSGVTLRDILSLNGWKKNKRVNPGQPVSVPLVKVSREKFEENRYKYHQRMMNGFLASHSISGVDNRVLQKGQTIWTISGDGETTPMWLLTMYNTDKKLDKLHPGEIIRVPLVHRKVS